MMTNRRGPAFGHDRPAEARGLLPLILGAIAAGNSIYKAINANQVKQRNKGYINDAYRSAMQRQLVHEGDVRQGQAESLASRGLLQMGAVNPSKIRAAMMNGGPQAGAIAPSSTLGEREQNETSRELGLERYDLDKAREHALNENKADALNAEIGAIGQGAAGVAQAYNAGQELDALRGTPPLVSTAPETPTDAYGNPVDLGKPGMMSNVGLDIGSPSPSRIQTAMGIANPSAWWGGIHGVDPFGAAGSSWNTKQTVTGGAAQDDQFHL